ncbi:hypothetical protein [Alishewanella sp. SMS8]|uniref:hypothetical protein n=1 Tax=Alishewanella sp. SMS8 TaxID=2994676 RepID=UPI0027421400|nr:hypothetical protein [Alishewanella sp. SMS8]MDP5459572.1 hypothetical protein [Alishewanella sp. SMS8]
MHELKDIAELEELKRDYFISELSVRASDGTIVLYIPVEHVSEIAKTGYVSRRQLDNLSCKLAEKYGVPIAVLVTFSPKFEKIAQAAELLLKAKFSDILEEANFSFLSSEKVNAWIKLNQLTDDNTFQIESYLQSILIESGVNFLSCQWVDENAPLPTPINVLIALKRLQPVNIERLIGYFITDYRDVNGKWLNRQLDKMIKKQLIIRDKISGNYALTGNGLGLIPAIRSKNNTDILRALELGKRKW